MVRRAYSCMRCRNRGTPMCPVRKPGEPLPTVKSWGAFLSLRMRCIEGQLDWTEKDKREAIQELREKVKRWDKY